MQAAVFLPRATLLFIILANVAEAFQPDPAVLRKVYEDAVSRAERLYGNADTRTAQAARDLGFFLKDAGDSNAAARAFTKALRIDQANLGDDNRQTLAGLIALASVSPASDAELLLRRVLASPSINSPLAVPALSAIGDLRLAAGDKASAAGNWRLALQHAEAASGKESEPVGKLLNSLAQVVPPPEAVTLLQRALDLAQHLWGERHPETATCEINLARAQSRAGDPLAAAAHARRGLAGFEAALGPQHPRVAVALATLADALLSAHHAPEAEALYRRAFVIDRQAFGNADPRTVQDARALMAVLRATGQVRQAREWERDHPPPPSSRP